MLKTFGWVKKKLQNKFWFLIQLKEVKQKTFKHPFTYANPSLLYLSICVPDLFRYFHS